MKSPRPIDVLLLSAAPQHHRQVLDTLRARGLQAQVARTSREATRFISVTPPLVLVDLANPVALSRAAVHTLNTSRGASLVVALHEGTLRADLAPLTDLSVDGFCHARDWHPVAHFAMPAAVSSAATLH